MVKHGTGQNVRTNSDWNIAVLSVSPTEDDHRLLRDIFNHGDWVRQSNCNWRMNAALTFEAAVSVLDEKTISIVLCESELLPGRWKDLLGHISALKDPPLMIVTSRHADEYLWAEALNLGAYDVLSKPFHADELGRALTSASLRWRHRRRGRQQGGAVSPA